MGTEASKPLEPPAEWNGRGNDFQMISPVSDISNPSDIHKLQSRRSRHHSAAHDRNRRTSRTVTKSLSQLQGKKQVPQPSAFYFPTKETERRIEQSRRANEAEQKENAKPKGPLKKIFGCFSQDEQEEMARIQQEPPKPQVVHTTKTKSAKSSSRQQQRSVSDFDAKPFKEQTNMSGQSRRSSSSGMSKKDEQPAMQQILASAQHSFVIRESEGMVDPEEYCNGNSESLGIAGMGLHHEDDYFARLTTAEISRYSEVQDSPCVNENKALKNLPSALGEPVADSPVNNFFLSAKKEEDAKSSTGSIEKAITEDLEESPEKKTSEEEEMQQSSPVSNLLRLHAQVGQLAETPGVYSDEEDKSVEVFLDETYESSEPVREHTRGASLQSNPSATTSRVSGVTLGTIASYNRQADEDNGDKPRNSLQSFVQPLVHLMSYAGAANAIDAVAADDDDDESAVLSYFRPEEKNAESAFRSKVPKEPIRQIATLGRGRASDVSKSSKSSRSSKISKLESLFRPMLPALSMDDAQSLVSYDPYEIKVTESAPSVIESADYRALALRSNYCSPANTNLTLSKKLDNWSPSMVSIDSAVHESPAGTKVVVSDQAVYNSEFLFANDYGPKKRPTRANRDSGIFSISTIGSRSRTSNRAKAVPIQARGSASVVSDDDESRRGSYGSRRRVRFSTDTASVSDASKVSDADSANIINIQSIERKMSDLTESTGGFGHHTSSVRHSKSIASNSPIPEEPNENEISLTDDLNKILEANDELNEASDSEDVEEGDLGSPNDAEDEEPGSPNDRVRWYHTTKDGVPAVTPAKGRTLKDATNSPYLRFQANRSMWSQAAEKSHGTVEVPTIENKVSDLTDTCVDFEGRTSAGSAKSNTVHEPIPEEEPVEIETPGSPEQMQVHWSYSVKDGSLSAVTPHLGKKSLENATKSPFLRFKSAKKKFVEPEQKELPVKSPKHNRYKAKTRKNLPGGAVSSRIIALNKRVAETRKLRKQRKSVGNPRRHQFVATNHIRSCAILNYKTERVDIKKINSMGAAKFNDITDILNDDLSVASSEHSGDVSYQEIMNKHMPSMKHIDQPIDEHEEEDDISHLSKDDISHLSKASTVATVRQEKDGSVARYQHRLSDFSQSTMSTSLSNVRKQVFRSSGSFAGSQRSRRSSVSCGDSTTLSSVLGKENTNYNSFRIAENIVKPTELRHHVTGPESLHLSPTQRTPMEARKWRSLAAAAKEKDSLKKSARKARKLAERNSSNKGPVYAI